MGMLRLSVVFLVTVIACAAPGLAAPARPDLFTVTGIKVEASAESAISARDAAMAQGRAAAWTKLFRRLTAAANWRRQPALDEKALERMIRGFEVANERRSTTRYLADVSFHFNPIAVRNLMRQANIAYTETRSPPVLVIPLVAGSSGFDPMSAWSAAWKDNELQQGLVPFVTLAADDNDLDVLDRPDVTQLDWAALSAMARRYNAGAVILASASDDAKTVQMIEVSPTGRVAASFAYAQSSFPADAQAVAERAEDIWKTRNAVDYTVRTHLVADVQFDSLDDWAQIRTGLAAVRSIADVEVMGLTLHEAEVDLTYSGRAEQLRDALAQQKLQLLDMNGQFTLQLAAVSAAK
jgi:Uncharacterized protein conserved in bacteria (DUF2066)